MSLHIIKVTVIVWIQRESLDLSPTLEGTKVFSFLFLMAAVEGVIWLETPSCISILLILVTILH